MNIKIKKGRHSANILQRLMQVGISIDRQKMERVVEFDITAKYDHPGTADDEDVNKLFGFGYGDHHKDSIRFGWNWNNDSSRVRLYAYSYVDGVREFNKLCEVQLNWKFLLSIEKIGNVYSLTVYDAKQPFIVYGGLDVPFTHKKRWSYNLGCFFGGQLPAPHDITIKISNK